jgi:hypothetical protein
MFPNLRPMPLKRRREPFSHPDWLFELKHDGFRALAFIQNGNCQLVSRNGNEFKNSSFGSDNASAENARVCSSSANGEFLQGQYGISNDRWGKNLLPQLILSLKPHLPVPVDLNADLAHAYSFPANK